MSLIQCPYCGTQCTAAETGGGSWVCGNCGKAIELPPAAAGIPAPPLPAEGGDDRWSEGPPEDSANRWSAQAPLGDESSSNESVSQTSILPRGAEEAVLVRRPRSPLAWTLVLLAVFLAALCGVVVLARSIRPWLEARKTAAQQATVEFWWPQLDSGSDDEFRAEAAAAIVALGPKAVCRTLEHISKESSDGQHFRFVPGAVRALAETGVDSVPALCEGLRRPEAKVRAVSATILERMGATGRGARDCLLTALDDPNRLVRDAAVDALGYLGDDAGPAAPRLAEFVAAGDVAQRKRAIQALGRIGPEARAATGALRKAKAEDPNGLVGAAAAQALKQIEVERLAREARREASGKLQARLQALAGDDAPAAIAAAQALGELGFKDGQRAAAGLALMLHHSDPKRRLAAALALGRLGLAAADFTPTLEAAARDEDAEVRAAAAKALEAPGKPIVNHE
jgi:hypothetical protein